MFFHRTPWLVQKLYPSLVWSVPTKEKVIYLTFDDGPIPDLTEFILETLKKYDAKGTFFCVGDNLRKHPEIAKRALNEGHKLANHTFNHLAGWSVNDEQYICNIQECEKHLAELKENAKLFRPPYGKIKRSQISKVAPNHKIIMWDVLSGDYSKKINPEQCLRGTIKATRKGSIVLFHDNVKAEANMKYALPRFLDHFSSQGFVFKSL
ncbi:polysaccharide deacetylase family protein [Fulvivirga sp.]|uniref:polysaccharide deacetylase family protein n=1 Tax=Fulvivirga sp. TaxID=1931237 RepID=UPI0032EB9DF9